MYKKSHPCAGSGQHIESAPVPEPGHCCPVGAPQEAWAVLPEGLYTLIPLGQQTLWVGN